MIRLAIWLTISVIWTAWVYVWWTVLEGMGQSRLQCFVLFGPATIYTIFFAISEIRQEFNEQYRAPNS